MNEETGIPVVVTDSAGVRSPGEIREGALHLSGGDEETTPEGPGRVTEAGLLEVRSGPEAGWQPLALPVEFDPQGVVGTDRDGDTVYATGGVRLTSDEYGLERPALFAVDVAHARMAEVPLPARKPRRYWRDPFHTVWIDPSYGYLEGRGLLRDGLLVDNTSCLVCTIELYDSIDRLYAVDLERDRWSTVQLRSDAVPLDMHVGDDRTARAVTGRSGPGRAELWTSVAAGPWRRTPLRRPLAELTGMSDSAVKPHSARITSDRVLLSMAGAVVALGLDGTPQELLYRWYEDGSVVHLP